MAESRIGWAVRHISQLMAASGTPLGMPAPAQQSGWPRRTKGFRSIPQDGTHHNYSRVYPYASARQIERQDRQVRRAEQLKLTFITTTSGRTISYAELSKANRRRISRLVRPPDDESSMLVLSSGFLS